MPTVGSPASESKSPVACFSSAHGPCSHEVVLLVDFEEGHATMQVSPPHTQLGSRLADVAVIAAQSLDDKFALGIVTKLLERGSLAALARLILHQLLREIAHRDTLTTHDEHALENVLQLPDIPRPGIALQLPHDFLIQLLGLE